jgi:hypothetical protein
MCLNPIRLNSKKNKIMASAKKIGVLSLVIVLLIGGGVFSFFYYGSYSAGYRAGKVTKISKKGYVFKTYEGELNLGMNEKPWAFSVDASKADVLKKLEDVSLTGENVKLHYEEKFVQFSWRGDTKYFVTRVENTPTK